MHDVILPLITKWLPSKLREEREREFKESKRVVWCIIVLWFPFSCFPLHDYFHGFWSYFVGDRCFVLTCKLLTITLWERKAKNLRNTSIDIEGWTVFPSNKEECLSWSQKKEMLHMFYFLYRMKKTRVDENDCLTPQECLVHFFFAYFCHPSSVVIRVFLLLCLTQDLMVSFLSDGIWETSSSLFSLLMPNPSFSRETMLMCQSYSLKWRGSSLKRQERQVDREEEQSKPKRG